MANLTITMRVELVNLTQQTAENQCYFGLTGTTTGLNYTLDANIGDIVTWQGSALVNGIVSDRIVNIKKIQKQGGSDVFGSTILQGNNGNPETVSGTIQNNTLNEQETYTVFFSVVGMNGQFSVDPIIRVRAQ